VEPGRENDFCPWCRSWFCPHAKPALYTDEERERYLAAIAEQRGAADATT
jgi:hypothetical protein